ncbi:MAG: hypothetical protein K2I03_12185 [Lachnospiraceae bacterium]|nr:hypothetical protein [Lachnospiraceae bacterium]
MIENEKQITEICKYIVQCIVNENYKELENRGILDRVSEKDLRRRLSEYKAGEHTIMPPDQYFDNLEIHEYNNKSGYWVDIDLWYIDGRSDLTLQLDIGKDEKILIDDLHVL